MKTQYKVTWRDGHDTDSMLVDWWITAMAVARLWHHLGRRPTVLVEMVVHTTGGTLSTFVARIDRSAGS